MLQLVQENKTLWRIKKNYLKDVGNAKEIKAFWTKLAKEKETHVKELTALIKKYVK